MRGKVKTMGCGSINAGITPAYAGKRLTVAIFPTSFQDHPRLCGEKLYFWFMRRKLQGSPPPMRGKGQEKHVDRFQKRITPAYAGKSEQMNAEIVTSIRITPAYAGKSLKHGMILQKN